MVRRARRVRLVADRALSGVDPKGNPRYARHSEDSLFSTRDDLRNKADDQLSTAYPRTMLRPVKTV
jgi:hypothetical protein